MAGSKGLSPLVSYVFAILLTVVVITGVSVLVGNFHKIIIEDEVKRELTQISAQTSSKITELYSLSKDSRASPENSSAILLAEAKLNLPAKAATRGYQITLLSANQITNQVTGVTLDGEDAGSAAASQTAKIIAETTEDPFVKVEYDVPSIGVDIQGRADDPSSAMLRYYRYNVNETSIDAILLGDYELIGRVTAVD